MQKVIDICQKLWYNTIVKGDKNLDESIPRKEDAMARPKKERVICSSPPHRHFAPVVCASKEAIVMHADEYEVLRLHDLEHLTQSEVAAQMLVSRPTVTQLLNSAHEKLADALVHGKPLQIQDGCCSVCEIGKACPPEVKETCDKKCRCKASCRYEQQLKEKNN